MNIQNLSERHQELIANMEGRGYCNDYIARLRREIDKVLSNSNRWQSYSDIYHEYENQGMTKVALHHRLACLGIIERFDALGEFPDGRTRQRIISHGREQYLLPEFKHILDTYRDYELQRGMKKASTIYSHSSSAASFLYALQCTGIDKPEEITQQSVIDVFLNEDGSPRWCSSYKSLFAGMFLANAPSNPELFTRLAAYLPDLRRVRKNIQYLTDEEVIEIKRVLTDGVYGLSYRDMAMGTLALNYGLRGCDIVMLKLNSVDMAGEKISIIQEKTAMPLELPLTQAVGNALYDYVTLERPASDSEYVFLSERRPFQRLASGGHNNVSTRIMKAAGIRQNPGDRKGFHIFRYRTATKLLENGVAQPIISKIVGHTSPDSLESYLSADFEHLKGCALSLDSFPLGNEVFAYA